MKKNLFFVFFILITVFSFAVKTDITEKLEQFKNYAVEVQEKWGVPGMAIGIVKGDEVIFKEVFGYRSQKKEKKVDFDTTFQIGSTSKAFTSTLMAMLAEAGELEWTDKVRDYYPEFEMYDAWVTQNMEIRDIMAQHSGMAPYAGDLTQFAGYDADYLLSKLKYIKPLHTFRTDFTYVNSLFLVAERIIENITGKDFKDFLKERIFDPLGMVRSTITYEEHLKNDNKTITHVYRVVNENEVKKINIIPLDFKSKAFKWSYNFAPAGGIDSSITDMLKWLNFHVNNGVFDGKVLMNSASLDFLYTPATMIHSNKYGNVVSYCQGWVYETVGDHTMIWHNGSTIGSKTMIAFFPELDLGIVILSNVGDINMPDNLAKDFLAIYTGNEFRKLALTEINSLLEEEVQTSEVIEFEIYPPLAFGNYIGRFYNDVYGEIEVFVEDENLYFRMGPNNSVLDLTHINRDTFSLYLDLLEMGDLGSVTFIVDSKGVAKSVEIDFIKDEGSGVFKRID